MTDPLDIIVDRIIEGSRVRRYAAIGVDKEGDKVIVIAVQRAEELVGPHVIHNWVSVSVSRHEGAVVLDNADVAKVLHIDGVGDDGQGFEVHRQIMYANPVNGAQIVRDL